MKIKEIEISGFRKIRKAKLSMEENITIIAGPNNSGKTSLVELFNCVFGSGKIKLCSDDISITECQEWSNTVYPVFLDAFQSNKTKDDTISDIYENIFSFSDTSKAKVIPPIEIKIRVDYNKNNDDIRNFADYLMDFDPDNSSFYFVYLYDVDPDSFRINLYNDYEKIAARIDKLDGTDKDKNTIRIIKEMLISLYEKSSNESVYFSDKDYKNRIKMDLLEFRSLFNYQNIMAGRKLDDENSDRTKTLSKNVIDIASKDENWKNRINDLSDKILQPIQDAGIRETIQSISVDILSETIDAISKTNGGHTGDIILDMEMTEDAIKSLLKNITSAKYQMDEWFLKESSQGLGYSNMIYILLQLEKYKKTKNPFIVNFFVIEEPEAHMHPQMQNVFIRYLHDFFRQNTEMQGFVTTHSHEVVRSSAISQLRVLRQSNRFECKLYDFCEFNKSISENKELLEFYNWFYNINFPDILFADKIIMYEGDTERMLIKSLINFEDFAPLKNQYISFIQVGGAYALNYKTLIDFLEIKTVIITDLDYEKELTNIEKILNSKITNSTIKKFAKQVLGNNNPTVKELYEWQEEEKTIIIDDLICLAFQGKNESYSRTLEEAMLSKYYSVYVFDKKKRDDWIDLREKDGLKYTIPNTGEMISIRDIVSHMSNGKTDFMYSVILKNLVIKMLPEYIKEALLWLMK